MKAVFALALLSLTACATLTAESDQAITVTTTPADASCTLVSTNGSWVIPKTPGTAVVTRGFSPLNVSCTTANGLKGSTVIEAGTRGRAYGNILLLGIPAVVDASTGKGYEYSPDSITLELK